MKKYIYAFTIYFVLLLIAHIVAEYSGIETAGAWIARGILIYIIYKEMKII